MLTSVRLKDFILGSVIMPFIFSVMFFESTKFCCLSAFAVWSLSCRMEFQNLRTACNTRVTVQAQHSVVAYIYDAKSSESSQLQQICTVCHEGSDVAVHTWTSIHIADCCCILTHAVLLLFVVVQRTLSTSTTMSWLSYSG